jgi:hypothetical protein
MAAAISAALYVDVNTAFSLHQPEDHTLTGSGSVSRHNEVGLNMATAGVEWNVANVIGRLHLQFGNTLAMVQDGDGSVARGRTLSVEALKHVREAAVGYHFDVLDGVNVEAGLFSSFVGADGYLLADNWLYNRALVSEFTPFYFTGVRAQVFIGDVKIEPWIINGYQTYGRFNEAPSVGLALRWAANEALVLVANGYAGFDTPGEPERLRLHHDHTVQWRLFNSDDNAVLHRVALSVNNHLGGETGGTATFDDHLFAGTAVVLRGSLFDDVLAVSARGEVLHERGAYSLQLPPAGFADDVTFTGATLGVEWMPTDFFSVRPEAVYRTSTVPFFAGPGGTSGTTPDLRSDQVLFTLAATARL